MTPQEFAPGLVLRGITPPLRLQDFGLIAFDMDSTLINIECIDEIADAAGRKAEVAAITAAAMRGEIADYKDSLRQRVALLKGVPLIFVAEAEIGCAARDRDLAGLVQAGAHQAGGSQRQGNAGHCHACLLGNLV